MAQYGSKVEILITLTKLTNTMLISDKFIPFNVTEGLEHRNISLKMETLMLEIALAITI